MGRNEHKERAISAFKARLSELGFASYSDYLAADHWKQFKEQYRSSGRSLLCAVCSCKPVQLHHHTYARLGCEHLEDVTPLCRDHHEAVHDWLKANCHGFVDQTHKAIAALQGCPIPAKPKKNRPSKKDRKRKRMQERFPAGSKKAKKSIQSLRAIARQEAIVAKEILEWKEQVITLPGVRGLFPKKSKKIVNWNLERLLELRSILKPLIERVRAERKAKQERERAEEEALRKKQAESGWNEMEPISAIMVKQSKSLAERVNWDRVKEEQHCRLNKLRGRVHPREPQQ